MKQTSSATASTTLLPRYAKQSLPGAFISFSQITASRLCLLYLKLNGGYTLNQAATIDASRRYLFVANHQSQLDPFSVFAALSLKENLDAAPVRFLTARTVYYTFMLPLLKSMGCYPTRGKREQIIAQSVGLLRHGYNVFMFPEGKRTLEINSEPRPGVSDLIKKASEELDVTMILVHIEWQRKRYGRRHVTVSLAPATEDLYRKDATEIMNALYKV